MWQCARSLLATYHPPPLPPPADSAGPTTDTRSLHLHGVNLGAACAACSSHLPFPGTCPALPCTEPAAFCGNATLPVVSVFYGTDATPWPCALSCISLLSDTVTALTCTTRFPHYSGVARVVVAGRQSASVPLDFEGVVAAPVLNTSVITPHTCPTHGCVVTVGGAHLELAAEVVVTNALGAVVLPATSLQPESLTVRCRRGVAVGCEPFCDRCINAALANGDPVPLIPAAACVRAPYPPVGGTRVVLWSSPVLCVCSAV